MNGKSESREGNGMIINKSIRLVLKGKFFFFSIKILSGFLVFPFFFFFVEPRMGRGRGEGKRVCSREQDGTTTEARRDSTCNLVRYVSLNVELNPGMLTFAFFLFSPLLFDQ